MPRLFLAPFGLRCGNLLLLIATISIASPAFAQEELPEGAIARLEVEGDFLDLDISPDGSMLAVATDDTIHVWNMETMEREFFLEQDARRNSVEANELAYEIFEKVEFSPSGNTLAMFKNKGRDDLVLLWDTNIWEYHFWYLRHIAISPQDGIYAGISVSGEKLWLLKEEDESGESLEEIDLSVYEDKKGNPIVVEDITTIKFSPDGSMLAAGFSSSYTEDRVYLFDVYEDSLGLRHQFSEFDVDIDETSYRTIRLFQLGSLIFSSDGRSLITQDVLHTISWDTETGDYQSYFSPYGQSKEGAEGMAVSSDESVVFFIEKSHISVWDLESLEKTGHIDIPEYYVLTKKDIKLFPDNQILVSGASLPTTSWRDPDITQILFWDTSPYLPDPMPTAVEEAGTAPSVLSLFQNYPNPFNSETTIRFQTQKQEHLKIYDARGALVLKVLATGGQYVWNGKDYMGNKVSTGVYFYQVGTTSRKMLMIK